MAYAQGLVFADALDRKRGEFESVVAGFGVFACAQSYVIPADFKGFFYVIVDPAVDCLDEIYAAAWQLVERQDDLDASCAHCMAGGCWRDQAKFDQIATAPSMGDKLEWRSIDVIGKKTNAGFDL